MKKVPEQLRSSPAAGAPVVYFWPGADIPDCLARRPPIGSRDRFARSPCIDFNALAWRSAFSSGATLSKCWHRHGHHHRRHNQRHRNHKDDAFHKRNLLLDRAAAGCTTGSPRPLVPIPSMGRGSRPLTACTTRHPSKLVCSGASARWHVLAVAWELLVVANFREHPSSRQLGE